MRWLALVSLVVVIPLSLRGDQIGVGLPFEEIFVQEYWHNGKPYFAIANVGKKDTAVSTGAPDGPWRVESGQTIQVQTKPGRPGELLTVSTKKGRLGLINAPIAPPEQATKTYCVHLGVNGSGGRFSAYYTQKDWTFPSEGTIEIDLNIPTNKGTVTFLKTPQEKYPLPHVSVTEAKCDSLTVTDDGKAIVIDSARPLKNEDMHVVRLKMTAPKVKEPTMVLLDGWHAIDAGTGNVVARGVIVAPAR